MPPFRTRISLHDEGGHMDVAGSSLLGAAGAIALGIGAATDTGWLAIAGGIGAALAFVLGHIFRHGVLDKGFFRRLDALEGKTKQ